MTIALAGRVLDDIGNGINGATIKAIPVGLSSPDGTTTSGTHANGDTGWWTITGLSDAKNYKVRVEYQNKVREFYGLSEVQFGRLVIGKRTLEVQSTGLTYHKYETAPGNGASVNSPIVYLVGAYDSDPGAGTTVTDKKMGLCTTVATDGTYKLSVLDDTGAEKAAFISSGKLLLGTATDAGEQLQINGDLIRLMTAKTPATAGAAGNAGDICWDSGFIYICTSTNTWKKVAIATW